jgi:hypothetical protein
MPEVPAVPLDLLVPAFKFGVSTSSANNLDALQAAVTAASGGGILQLPFAPPLTPLLFTGSTAITGESNLRIVGHGDGTVLAPQAGRSTPFIDFDACSNVTLGDFCIVKASGADTSGTAYGIRIRGDCSGINLEKMRIDGMVNAVRISGVAGSGATSAMQTIRFGGAPTGGTFTLGFWPLDGGDLQTTSAITYSTTASTTRSNIATALGALAGIGGTGNITVATVSATEFTVNFGADQLASLPIFLLRGDRGTSLTGGSSDRNVTVLETQKGGQWVRRVHLERITALNSPTEYGIAIEHVDGWTASKCFASGNLFDGLKGIRWCHNGQVLGGDYSRNGGWYKDTPNEGTGIDLYAGGETTRIIGATCNENFGAGIQIKNDSGASLSGYGSGKYGLSRRIEVVGVHACRNQAGPGLSISSVTAAGASYSSAHITVSGGMFEDNAIQGMVLNGRNITANGVKCRRNRSTGIYVGQYSKYVDLNGCQSIANGTASNTGYGLDIEGQKVRVRGGIYIGTDQDNLTDATDETGYTKYHNTNIRITGNASDVIVDDEVMSPEGTNATSRPVQVVSGATDILLHRRGTLTPNSSLIYGSPGSTYFVTSTGVKWTKISGAVDAVGVWGQTSLSLTTVAATIDFPSINNAASNTQNVTVTGAAVGDNVLVVPPVGFHSGFILRGQVTSTSTVGVVAHNASGSTQDAASGTFTITVFKA